MNEPKLAVAVRFHSRLPYEEIVPVLEERLPQFRALKGLQQKYYLQDPETGEYTGLYLWESAEDFAAYRESELRASIAEAYQVEGEPKVQVLKVLKLLRDATT
ncbi:MAG: hypothetical protein R2748_23555 [Bryobacterales bacterium]